MASTVTGVAQKSERLVQIWWSEGKHCWWPDGGGLVVPYATGVGGNWTTPLADFRPLRSRDKEKPMTAVLVLWWAASGRRRCPTSVRYSREIKNNDGSLGALVVLRW